MPLVDVDIVNDALGELGEEPIVTMTDTTKRAKLANRIYARTRDYVLRVYNWNFATVRVELKPWDKPATNLTLSALTGTGITVTASGATFAATDVNRLIEELDAAGAMVGQAKITAFTSTTVVTADVKDDFTATPVNSPNWRFRYLEPKFDFDQQYKVPSTALKIQRVGTNADPLKFRVEQNTDLAAEVILADSGDTAEVLYTKQETDPAKFDLMFVYALELQLAARMAYALTGRPSVRKQMEESFVRALLPSQHADSQEGTLPPMVADDLTIVR